MKPLQHWKNAPQNNLRDKGTGKKKEKERK